MVDFSDWRCVVAALFFNDRQMDLSVALANMGELKNVIFNELKGIGFTDVVDSPSEVAGNRNGVRVSILHLPISGRSFWQVFMAGGDTVSNTQQTLNEVVDKVEHLVFL
jgi:hypothetical protein